ncbi:MAG TPA: DUF4145 domain-containing protein [Candidatus Saccharimonadales bacterium]|nr:DUF4145 domain-containing protein [Candidatus Saccharimonadales bacterium]
MNLPKHVKLQYLARFDDLIKESTAIINSIQVHPPGNYGNVVMMYTTYRWDSQSVEKWKTSCLSLFQPLVSKGTKLYGQVDLFGSTTGGKPKMQKALGILEAFRDDFDKGFLDDFLLKVEAEIAADYMGQADTLLKEGQPGAFDHVPAAVLSGAVLEKALRTLCDRQQPQIPITNANGDSKTLNPLIDDLKKAGVFNELKAKQLRAWADIRNKAAHGEFNQFTKGDVEQMLVGIANFLADYLQ